MTNVQTKIDGDVLTITVDLSKDYGLSKSGKSRIIASTHGAADLAANSDIKLNLNIYKKT